MAWSRCSKLIWAIFVAISFATTAAWSQQSLQELKQVQQQIQETVAKVMPAVVAVTDGQGFGSGVVVSADGLVLTAGHVMSSPFDRGYEVIFPDGRVLKAKPLGKNLNVDAGMIKIAEPGTFPYVELAEESLALGQWVISLGHSGGYDLGRKPPVRTGRVLSHRDHQVITDAVLIGGDSGGPLFDLEGRVAGIHSSIGDSIAENRHVTIDTFRKHWAKMEAGERWGELPTLASKDKKQPPTVPPRPKMGVVVDRTADNALIKEVRPGSPAQRAGLLPGDIVTKFDGEDVVNSKDLIDKIKTKTPGIQYSAEILRNGLFFRAEIVLERF